MSDQSVVDELIAQRDRVLFGKWVPRAPRREGEACLAFHHIGVNKDGTAHLDGLSFAADCIVRRALSLHGVHTETILQVARWNDRRATRQDVLDVLDEAIRLAKGST